MSNRGDRAMLVAMIVSIIAIIALPALALDGDPCTANDECGIDEYCAYRDASCLSDAPYGECRYVPPGAGCTTLWMPVCGCDLQTYSNGCNAEIEYVSLLYPGECETCGSTQGACPPGRVCLHATSNACGDANPGSCVPAAEREPRTFVFEGTVGTIFDGLGLFPGVAAGDRFHGSLTYDLTTPDTGFSGEGQFGLYEHDAAPAGVRLTLGERTVRSVATDPQLAVYVHDDVGILGVDAFGFVSGNSELSPTPFSPGVIALELDWRLSQFVSTGNPFTNAALPSCPIDPGSFESNELDLLLDCIPCLGPASFVELTGTIDVFDVDLVLEIDRDEIRWSQSPQATAFDVVTGDLALLGDFAAATSGCLADDHVGTSRALDADPAPGEGRWYIVRPERSHGPGSWDSSGGRQDRPRDAEIDASGVGCP